MRLLKLTTSKVDSLDGSKILEPKGLKQPQRAIIADQRGMIEGETQLFIVPDDEASDDDHRCARPEDLPLLDKLGHPHHGKRYISVVLSGMGDMTVDERGRVIPLDPPLDEEDLPTAEGGLTR